MNLKIDQKTIYLMAGVVGLLVVSSLVGWFLARKKGSADKTVANLNARIKAWWMMVAVFGVALLTGGIGSLVLFGLMSFLAFREFITLTPTHPADHRALFWSFFVVTPLQYYFIGIDWLGMFTIFIPVYAFLLIPTRNAIAGDCVNFLERTAKIQWGLMICVYCVSYAPALLTLKIPGYEGQNGRLLFFFVLIVQISDVFQYVWGKLFGRTKVAPLVSPNKTWEGLIGGILTASAIGMGLWWATPFNVWQAGVISLVICLMGFAGGLTMSAIKRDRGVKDYGNLIEGHGGVMDRIDSLSFAAPVFFHLTRYYFT